MMFQLLVAAAMLLTDLLSTLTPAICLSLSGPQSQSTQVIQIPLITQDYQHQEIKHHSPWKCCRLQGTLDSQILESHPVLTLIKHSTQRMRSQEPRKSQRMTPFLTLSFVETTNYRKAVRIQEQNLLY